MQKLFMAVSMVLAVFVFMACGASDSAQPTIGIRFVLQTDAEGCPASQIEEGLNQLPSDVEALNFTLYAQSGQQLVSTRVVVATSCDDPYECVLQNASDFQLFNVPSQQNMQLEVEAFGAGNQLTWLGNNYDVDVTEQEDPVNQPAQIDIYMRRVGKMTYGYDCMQPNRMFHSATLLRDRTSVLIAGGVSVVRPNSCSSEEFGQTVECDLMVATSTVVLFDMETGTFKEMTELDTKRAGHEAVLLSDGRVLIMGGSEQLYSLYNKDGRAYIEADPTKIKNTAVVYNPNGRGHLDAVVNMAVRRIMFTATPIDRDPPFATRFLIAGGWGEGGRLTTLEMLEFDPEEAPMPAFRQLTINLKAGRTGHTATRIRERGHVLFYGGSAAGDAVAEVFTTESEPTQLMDSFANSDQWANLYYHAAAAFDSESKVLITGGMQKISSGSNERLSDPMSNAMLLDLDTNEESFLDMDGARAFHSMEVMGDNLVLTIGGVAGFNLESGIRPIIAFDGTDFAALLDSLGNPVSLGVSRYGHTSTIAGDDSILIVGGAEPDPTSDNARNRSILGSAEVYMPTLDLISTDDQSDATE